VSDQLADAPIDPEQCLRTARAHLKLAESALHYSTTASVAAWRVRDALAQVGYALRLAAAAREQREEAER
jgi:hypothetical protein